MSTSTGNALECRLGLGRVVLPTESVDLLGEYQVGSSLPLAERVNFAIGVWGEDPILSISLTIHEPTASRTARGALIVGSCAGLRCAFEIDEPVGLVSIVEMGVSSPNLAWRRSATLGDGRTLQFIDIPMLVRELSGVRRE